VRGYHGEIPPLLEPGGQPLRGEFPALAYMSRRATTVTRTLRLLRCGGLDRYSFCPLSLK